ncbi:MAG: LamG domain-containing protein, partial [Opitutaceae bacterium]
MIFGKSHQFGVTARNNPSTDGNIGRRYQLIVGWLGCFALYAPSVVQAQNAAPVAAASTFTTLARNVSDSSNAGNPVSVLVANFTDSDAGALKGLAVTTVDTANGSWQFSTNAGVTWFNLTGVSQNAARLLKGSDTGHRVRFVPSANFNGTSTLTYRAWDQTTNSPALSLGTGLVAHLSFEGSLGDQSSQGTHSGTWSGSKSPFLVANAPAGGSGGGYSAQFDGATDRIDLANSADLNVNNSVAFSVAAWIKTDFSDGQRVIIAKAPASGSSSATKTAALFVSSSGNLRFDNYFIAACESSAVVRTGAWVHVAMTYDGSTYRLFVN